MASKLNKTYQRYANERAGHVRRIGELDILLAGLVEAGAVPDEVVAIPHAPVSMTPNKQRALRGELPLKVIQVLEQASNPIRHRDVTRNLLANGFKPSGKKERFHLYVAKTLARLHGQNRINGERIRGFWHYHPKLSQVPLNLDE